HMTAAEIARLSSRLPEVPFRARVGTQLWLGDRSFFEARGTVLDVMRMAKGDRYGYRERGAPSDGHLLGGSGGARRRASGSAAHERKAPSDGHLLVVSGGPSHGIGMEAPKAVIGAVRRAKVVAAAGLASMNRNLSPFTWQGKQRGFAEPPHMQVSLLWLPADVPPPVPGDELPADVRMTTTHFHRIPLVYCHPATP